MQAGTGYSRNADSLKQALEASDAAMGAANLVKAQAAIVFATSRPAADYNQFLEGVRRVTAAPVISGASACGVLTQDEEIEEGPGCAILVLGGDNAGPPCSSTLVQESPLSAPRQSLPAINAPGSAIIFCDPGSFNPASSPHQWVRAAVPIFGGGASGFTPSFNGAPVLFQNQALRDASVFMDFDRRLKAQLAVAYSCRALSAPLAVTKVNNNLILELSGQPATKILERELAAIVKEAKNNSQSWERPLPILAGVIFDGAASHEPPGPHQYYVRPILAIDPSSGGILMEEKLPPGSRLTFVLREKEWAHREMKTSLKNMRRHLGGAAPQFGIYFNCAGRGRDLYGTDNHDITLIRQELGNFPLIGMFSSFELTTHNHGIMTHGFTGVLGAFSYDKSEFGANC
ncbi:MAG: FIST C-terminal domain-containing protein [Elusimicrobia bacterium]|nr:FIST C-terminal domain-containing protein [Elusimicrobiota bacterium]